MPNIKSEDLLKVKIEFDSWNFLRFQDDWPRKKHVKSRYGEQIDIQRTVPQTNKQLKCTFLVAQKVYDRSLANWNMFNYKRMIFYNFFIFYFFFTVNVSSFQKQDMIHYMFIETFELLLPINNCHLLCEAQRIFFINDKPSWFYPVKNNVSDVTRYAGQGFLVIFLE